MCSTRTAFGRVLNRWPFCLPLVCAFPAGAVLIAKSVPGYVNFGAWALVTRVDTFAAKVSRACDTGFGGSAADVAPIAAVVTADVAVAADFILT